MMAARRDIAALVFVHVFPVLMSWLYLIVFAGESHTPGQITAVAIVFTTAKIVQFSVPAVYVFCFERWRLRPEPPRPRDLTFGLGFGLAVGLLICGVYFGGAGQSRLLAESPAKVHGLVRQLHADSPARYWVLAAVFSLGHSLLEEYYWRWFAFGWLRRYTPLGVAIAVSSLGFTAHHVLLLYVYFPGRFWMVAVPLAAAVGVGGAVWAWLYDRTGSLYAVWLSHALVDVALFVAGYAMLARYWADPLAG